MKSDCNFPVSFAIEHQLSYEEAGDMTSFLTGDDILQNNGVIPAAPSVDGILRTVVLPTAEKIDFSNYLGVWQGDGLDFDPSIKKTYKFLGDEGSKLTVENGPSKIGGLTSQAFKISFTSGDRSTIFTGNANLSDARFEPYPSELACQRVFFL